MGMRMQPSGRVHANPWIHSPTERKQKNLGFNFNTSSLTQLYQSLNLSGSTKVCVLPPILQGSVVTSHPSRLYQNSLTQSHIPLGFSCLLWKYLPIQLLLTVFMIIHFCNLTARHLCNDEQSRPRLQHRE